MTSTTTVDDLHERLRGHLIDPDDERYEDARALHHGMIDKRPRMIAGCANVADVISAVDYGREHDWRIAVRGGGHNGAGLGSCDDGLVIDLSPMNGVRVDPEKRTVQAEGGCTHGDVDHATDACGLACRPGSSPRPGSAGSRSAAATDISPASEA